MATTAKRYWDHTEQERAHLTEEQVRALLGYELMEKGVLAVEPLKLEEVQPVTLPTRRFYVLHEANGYGGTTDLGFAFESIEEAETLRRLLRFVRASGWNETTRVRPVRATQLVAEDLPDDDAVTAAKAALDENRRREQANAEAKRKHEEACKKVADATAGVWSDWCACREAEAQRQKIRDTFAEYRRMTGGDAHLARAFLAKAFPADEIEAAVGPEQAEAA